MPGQSMIEIIKGLKFNCSLKKEKRRQGSSQGDGCCHLAVSRGSGG